MVVSKLGRLKSPKEHRFNLEDNLMSFFGARVQGATHRHLSVGSLGVITGLILRNIPRFRYSRAAAIVGSWSSAPNGLRDSVAYTPG